MHIGHYRSRRVERRILEVSDQLQQRRHGFSIVENGFLHTSIVIESCKAGNGIRSVRGITVLLRQEPSSQQRGPSRSFVDQHHKEHQEHKQDNTAVCRWLTPSSLATRFPTRTTDTAPCLNERTKKQSKRKRTRKRKEGRGWSVCCESQESQLRPPSSGLQILD
jgi:hypothetical protein